MKDVNSMGGVMVHHVHNGTSMYPERQGSITQEQLAIVIKKLKVISADEWTVRYQYGDGKAYGLCLTFDDGLISQRLAMEVLDQFHLKAFFFLPTTEMQLERERWVRDRIGIDEFYKLFFSCVQAPDPGDYLKEFTFYTYEDRKFRYYRDHVGMKQYPKVVEGIINVFTMNNKIPKLHMEPIEPAMRGHYIGLHSHSHPIFMEYLSASDQIAEYFTNYNLLSKVTNHRIFAMSHPRNCYSPAILQYLKTLGIEIGFRANPNEPAAPLLLPRLDVTNLI